MVSQGQITYTIQLKMVSVRIILFILFSYSQMDENQSIYPKPLSESLEYASHFTL